MNVTIICEVLGEPNNGTSVAAYNLINHLKAKGHNVKVVCPDEDKRGLDGWYVLPKLKLGAPIDWLIAKNNVIPARFDKNVITEAIKDADVVHIMTPLFMARKCSKFVKKMGKPLTAGFHAQAENLTSHTGSMWSHLANHIVYRWYDDNLYRRADCIHYPTQFIRDLFEKERRRKTNGVVISNGVNDCFKPIPSEKPEEYRDKFCVLFIGRFSKEKSHKTLVKAVAKSKYADRIQLFFAGKGEVEEKVRRYAAKRLKNKPVIDFYTREELVKVINFCDLYCHPAEVEIEAIACLEAIKCGLVPVIANSPKCATKAFALDGRSLFKVNDSRDLAAKIDYFIEHPEARAELRERYLNESENFDQNACMEQMEQMLLNVAQKAKAAEEAKALADAEAKAAAAAERARVNAGAEALGAMFNADSAPAEAEEAVPEDCEAPAKQ